MNELYSGHLSHRSAGRASEELAVIRSALGEFAPQEIVWDFENESLSPPWGDNISPAITSLANYFVTSDGQDLIDVLLRAVKKAAETHADVFIS